VEYLVESVPGSRQPGGWRAVAKVAKGEYVYSPIFRKKKEAVAWAKRICFAQGEKLTQDRQPRLPAGKDYVSTRNIPRQPWDTSSQAGKVLEKAIAPSPAPAPSPYQGISQVTAKKGKASLYSARKQTGISRAMF